LNEGAHGGISFHQVEECYSERLIYLPTTSRLGHVSTDVPQCRAVFVMVWGRQNRLRGLECLEWGAYYSISFCHSI